MLALLVGVNLRGVRAGAAVQDAATVLKYGGVLLVALLGLLARPAPSEPVVAPSGMAAAVAALVPVLWAYDGWIDVTSIAGEVRDPARQIPRSLALGTALVTLLYLLVNVAYLRALGPAALAASETPAADAAARLAGASGRAGVSALVAIATFGGCAVALLTGSRVVYAVARDGLFLRAFAHTSRTAVPDVAVTASGALAVAYVVSPLGHLGEMFVVGAWPFYAVGAVATVVLRRTEPALPRPHRTVGYPVTIVVFALASLAIVAGYAMTRPMQTAISLGVIAVGLPVYALTLRRRG
jgi:APA family basic amino acid/polyamine antiporter